ncbi:MAG: HAD-IIB family hydrolase [Candidatus Nitrosocosmicus sp.]
MHHERRISAILSDYDGTLCPTSSINKQGDNLNIIPPNLEDILCSISKNIPVCIISSKDFYFIYKKIKKFSEITSCILGMETIFLNNITKRNNETELTDNKKAEDESGLTIANSDLDIISRHVLMDYKIILNNSAILNEIVNYIKINHQRINVEKKFLTMEEGLLGGITIDWRNDIDWSINKDKYEKILQKSLSNIYKKAEHLKMSRSNLDFYLQKLFIQQYSTHPFIDVYSAKISKGEAYDCVTSELFNTTHNKGNIMYLGDSENDNPAFKKSDISIGINSDTRLKPNLKCKYNLKFENLSIFLKNLKNNNFDFSESLLYF